MLKITIMGILRNVKVICAEYALVQPTNRPTLFLRKGASKEKVVNERKVSVGEITSEKLSTPTFYFEN
jgi:hypothetical protein